MPENRKFCKLTFDRRQRRDSMWFLATESPMNASFFPWTNSRNVLGSNLGRSHWSGFHLQFRKSVSFLPWWKQFFEVGIVVQLEFVYWDPCRSGIQWPLNKSQFKISSSSPKIPKNQKSESHNFYGEKRRRIQFTLKGRIRRFDQGKSLIKVMFGHGL